MVHDLTSNPDERVSNDRSNSSSTTDERRRRTKI